MLNQTSPTVPQTVQPNNLSFSLCRRHRANFFCLPKNRAQKTSARVLEIQANGNKRLCCLLQAYFTYFCIKLRLRAEGKIIMSVRCFPRKLSMSMAIGHNFSFLSASGWLRNGLLGLARWIIKDARVHKVATRKHLQKDLVYTTRARGSERERKNTLELNKQGKL